MCKKEKKNRLPKKERIFRLNFQGQTNFPSLFTVQISWISRPLLILNEEKKRAFVHPQQSDEELVGYEVKKTRKFFVFWSPRFTSCFPSLHLQHFPLFYQGSQSFLSIRNNKKMFKFRKSWLGAWRRRGI